MKKQDRNVFEWEHNGKSFRLTGWKAALVNTLVLSLLLGLFASVAVLTGYVIFRPRPEEAPAPARVVRSHGIGPYRCTESRGGWPVHCSVPISDGGTMNLRCFSDTCDVVPDP